jgi:hypothetical protein
MPQGTGGLVKASTFSFLSPTSGIVRRYCFFGILLALVVLVVHLAETSSILERSMLALTGAPAAEGSISTSSSSPRVIHDKDPARHADAERKERPKRLRSSSRSESADETVEKQCAFATCAAAERRSKVTKRFSMAPLTFVFFAFLVQCTFPASIRLFCLAGSVL